MLVPEKQHKKPFGKGQTSCTSITRSARGYEIGRPLPEFSPPLPVEFRPFKALLEERDPLSLFTTLFGPLTLHEIVYATNERAQLHYENLDAEAESPNPNRFTILATTVPSGIYPMARSAYLYGA